MHTSHRFLSRLLVGLTVVTFSAATAQECTEVLGAVRTVSEDEGTISTSSSFYRFFCDKTFSSYQDAKDTGGKVGIPIEAIPVEFGGHHRETEFSEYSRSVCETIRSGQQLSKTWKKSLQTANSQVVDAWETCINRNGLHFWAEIKAGSENDFILNAKWNPEGPPFSTTARGRISGLQYFQCEGDTIEKGTPIDSAGRALRCERKDTRAHSLLLTTDHGRRSVVIPQKPLPPTPPPACGNSMNDYYQALKFGSAANVQCFVDKRGFSATAEIYPPNEEHAIHLAADKCNLPVVKLLMERYQASCLVRNKWNSVLEIARASCGVDQATSKYLKSRGCP